MFARNLTVGPIRPLATPDARPVLAGGADDSAAFELYSKIPDLVNGNPNGFEYVFVSAGLPAEYHWAPAATFAALPDVADNDSYVLRASCLAAYHACLLIEAGVQEQAAIPRAVTLACARLAIVRAWRIEAGDIVESQLAPNVAARAVTAAGALDANVAHFATVAEFAARRIAAANLITGAHSSFFASVSLVAVAMPVTSGVIIARTQVHHYQDPHKAISDNVIMEKMGTNIQFPQGLDDASFKDVLCHKAAHPIKSGILVCMARSAQVKLNLLAVGLNTAAVRVPAEFGPESSASAIANLMQRVESAGRERNVAVSVAPATDLRDAVRAALTDAPTPQTVRAAAVLVETFKGAHGGDVAFAAGFMTALFEATSVPPRLRSSVNAWSIKGICAECPERHADGVDAFNAASRWARARAREGFLAGHGLMGADAPAERRPAEENTVPPAANAAVSAAPVVN